MIDTKLLRQKILDLAIRGKLVPQDPNDEPASELLKRIKAEKEALIKAGKIKRDKHESYIFRGEDKRYYEQIDGKTVDITEEIPFDIPDNWAWCRLKNVTMGFQYGTSEKSSPTGRIAVLRMGNLQAGEILYDNLAFTSNATEIARYQLIAGDLLFNRTNSAEHVGKTSIYRGNQEAIFAGYLIRFHPILTSSEFMNYVMNSSYHHSFCQTVKSDAVNQSNINAQKLSCFLFPLPPIDEQERIANQVESLLKYIDGIDENAVSLENTISFAKQKILDLAIRGKLVPQDPNDEPASELLKKIKAEKETLIKSGKLKRDKHESFIFRGDDNCYHENVDEKSVDITDMIPFNLPDSWEWVRLASLGSVIGGGTPSTSVPDYWDGAIPWLSPCDLSDYKGKYISRGKRNISQKGLDHSSAVLMPSGSILYSSRAPIGYVVIASNQISTNQGFKSLVPIVDGMDEFIYYTLKALTPDIRKRATGTTFKEISGSEFGKTMLPLPPLAEQKRIVSQIEKLFSILETMHG